MLNVLKQAIGSAQAEVDIPTLAQVSPKYAELTARHARMSERFFTEIPAEMKKLLERMQADGIVNAPGGEAAAAARTRVQELVGDAPQADGVAPQMDPALAMQRLRTERADLDAAMPLLAQRITAERMAASKLVCERIELRYREIVASLCATLVEAHGIMVEYQIFADTLNRDGVAWARLGPAPALFIGHPSDRQSQLAYYLRECAEKRLISSSSIPRELR